MIIAVVLAGWGDEIRRMVSRVKLTILFKNSAPDCQLIQATMPEEFRTFKVNTAVVRFRVGNDGSAPATNVEARLIRVWRSNGHAFVEDTDFLPLNLLWSNVNTTTTRVIHRGLPKHCDLLQAVNQGPDTPMTFRFLTEVIPGEVRPGVQPTIKPAGVYRARVAVTADGAEPAYKVFDIRFSGRWTDVEVDMFGKELEVRLL